MIFSKNNIDFRQVSSNAQSNFLKSKSFILTEITAKGGWDFSSTTKEIVLQTYRVWTTWLFDLEEYIVTCGEKKFSEDQLNHCEREVVRRGKELREHISNRTDWYDESFIRIITEVEDLKFSSLREVLRTSLLNLNVASAYNEIVGILINYMNHLMFVLHEVDYLLYHKENKFKPFIYIDNTDVNLYLKEKEFFPSGRLCLYQKLGLMTDEHLTIKLGISREYLRRNTNVSNAYTELLLKLRTHGAQVCCVV